MKTLTHLIVLILCFSITVLSTQWAHAGDPPQRGKPMLVSGCVVSIVGGVLLTVAGGLAIGDRVTYDPARPTMGTVILWVPLATVGAVHVAIGAPLAVVGGVRHERARRLPTVTLAPILTGGQAVGALGSVGFQF
jgi:hypothetical protein